MIKIIATTATNHHLLELLKSAKQRIILVSPYIRLHREIYHALKKQREAGLQIDVICRATESEAQIPMLQEGSFLVTCWSPLIISDFHLESCGYYGKPTNRISQ